MKKTFLILAIIATLAFGAFGTARIVKDLQFEVGCEQYLKRAADANTVETAKEELAKAISYAEENGLTSGVVSIILHQPENDVGFWYNNMREAYAELESLPEEASSLERTNVLMKLRETLTDTTDSDVSVTVPDGISIYPSNVPYCLWGSISLLGAIILWMLTSYYWDD